MLSNITFISVTYKPRSQIVSPGYKRADIRAVCLHLQLLHSDAAHLGLLLQHREGRGGARGRAQGPGQEDERGQPQVGCPERGERRDQDREGGHNIYLEF